MSEQEQSVQEQSVQNVQSVQSVQEQSVQEQSVQEQSVQEQSVQQNVQSPVITTEEKPKEKDPKRVAAGKRLAAISKKAKEEKMRRLLEQEETISWRQLSLLSIGISVLGYAGYKYFWQKQEEEEFVHEKVHVEEPKSKTTQKEERKQRGKPISMFD